MKKTALIFAVFAIFAVLTAGCSPRTANIQKEISQSSNFKIERKDAVSIPGLQGNIKFGGNMGMRFKDNKTLPEMWQFDHALSEQISGNNKALTVVLKATNISGKLNSSYYLILVNMIFYDQAGKEIVNDETCVRMIGKIDLERGRVESVKPGETLIIEPFFWVPTSRLNEFASYVIKIDAIAKCYARDAQEYFPSGSLSRTKNGVYKEANSAKGMIAVEYKTDPSGKIAKISLTAMGNVLAGARLRFNWLDKEGKVVLSEDKQDILQAISQYDRRYLFVNDRQISYIFDISFPQSEDQRIKYYEFWIETNK